MSFGRIWRSKLILILTTTTIAIANYQTQTDSINLNDNYRGSTKPPTNITQEDYTTSDRGPLKVPHVRHHHVSHRGPYFENAEGVEINDTQNIAHLGDTAILDCRIVMLSGKTVMWLRQSPEKALLTVGTNTHIADPRYSVKFKYPNNWRLAISPVRKEDHGLYVCQVNTHPPKMLVTNVTILAPEIRIIDEANHEIRDRYYKTGSIIELTCISRASQVNSVVTHPIWKKNSKILPDHVNVYHSNGTNSEMKTRIRIDHADKNDGGEFTCSVGQFSSSLVNIHVLNGEKQAAVHHDQWSSSRSKHPKNVENFLILLSSLLMLRTLASFLLQPPSILF